MKTLGGKTLLTRPAPSILKWLIEIKHDRDFYFHTSLWCVRKVSSERFHLFVAPKRRVEIKIYVIFSPYSIGTRVKTFCRFVELLTYAISVSLTIYNKYIKTILTTTELAINSTIKQYFSKIYYQTKLTLLESYCQILQTFPKKLVPGDTSFSLRYGLILNRYWLG